MKTQFAFLNLSDSTERIITLHPEAKEKRCPFVIVNTDNDRGLYVRKLEAEIAKYKDLISATGDLKFHGICTSNVIVFGDSLKYDYRTDMNYYILNSLWGKKDVKVYDLVDDYKNITVRLKNYCEGNGIKRKSSGKEFNIRLNIGVTDDWNSATRCPFISAPYIAPKKVERTLVNIYETPKPQYTVEDVTVHANWVKIGYDRYTIYVDLFGREFIKFQDGERMFVETDRLGRRYLTA